MDKEGECMGRRKIDYAEKKSIATICTIQQSVSSNSPQNRWVTQNKELRAIDLDCLPELVAVSTTVLPQRRWNGP